MPVLLEDEWREKWQEKAGLFLCQRKKGTHNLITAEKIWPSVSLFILIVLKFFCYCYHLKSSSRYSLDISTHFLNLSYSQTTGHLLIGRSDCHFYPQPLLHPKFLHSNWPNIYSTEAKPLVKSPLIREYSENMALIGIRWFDLFDWISWVGNSPKHMKTCLLFIHAAGEWEGATHFAAIMLAEQIKSKCLCFIL